MSGTGRRSRPRTGLHGAFVASCDPSNGSAQLDCGEWELWGIGGVSPHVERRGVHSPTLAPVRRWLRSAPMGGGAVDVRAGDRRRVFSTALSRQLGGTRRGIHEAGRSASGSRSTSAPYVPCGLHEAVVRSLGERAGPCRSGAGRYRLRRLSGAAKSVPAPVGSSVPETVGSMRKVPPRFLEGTLLPCSGCGGWGRGRTGDLPLFRRTLVPTELPSRSGPDGI